MGGNLLYENNSYLPPRHGKDVARVRSQQEYEELYNFALADNDTFLGKTRAQPPPLVKALGKGQQQRFFRAARGMVQGREAQCRL